MTYVEELMDSQLATKSSLLNRLMFATKFKHTEELLHLVQIKTVLSTRHVKTLNDGYMLLVDTIEDYPELQGANLYATALNLKKAYPRYVLLNNPLLHNTVTVLIAHIRMVIEKENRKNLLGGNINEQTK